MTLRRYTGYFRSSIGRDAAYTVTAAGEVRLEYRIDHRQRALLTTDRHSPLVEMVNQVKQQLNGANGGRFYINEFRDVLVPDGRGGAYWAGKYAEQLNFDFDGKTISPVPPEHLVPGALWEGPHVGIKYTLAAGGKDIRYEQQDGNIRTTEKLSEVVGEVPARHLAQRLAEVKGGDGGAIYINEASCFFAPVGPVGNMEFRYLGELGEDQWFYPQDEFEE